MECINQELLVYNACCLYEAVNIEANVLYTVYEQVCANDTDDIVK